MTIASNSD